MFLVKDRRLGMDNFVFTGTDPRAEGYRGEVTEGVNLEYDTIRIHDWPNGEPSPNPQLGRDPKNPATYRVFKYPEELQNAGFEYVHHTTPFVAYSLSEYRKKYFPDPVDFAQTMTPDEWFEYLDKADAGLKARGKAAGSEGPARGSNRDQIAEWVAQRHMGADGGIHHVWFLQSGAPADEIRLLEVSERFTRKAAAVEPIDFGLDVGGHRFKLLVADVSMEQLDGIKADPEKSLPRDWKIDGAVVWGRRGLLR